MRVQRWVICHKITPLHFHISLFQFSYVWLFLCFFFIILVLSVIQGISVYVVLLFNLYKNPRVDHMLLCAVILLVIFSMKRTCVYSYTFSVYADEFVSLSEEDVLYIWQPKSNLDLHFALYILFRVLRSPSLLNATTLMVFNTLLTFALTLSISSSQFSLLYKVISRKWVLSLQCVIWFLSLIYIRSSFSCLLFPNILFIVFLVEKVNRFSAAHASNLLVFLCSASVAVLWFLMIYTASTPPVEFPGLSSCSVIQIH